MSPFWLYPWAFMAYLYYKKNVYFKKQDKRVAAMRKQVDIMGNLSLQLELVVLAMDVEVKKGPPKSLADAERMLALDKEYQEINAAYIETHNIVDAIEARKIKFW